MSVHTSIPLHFLHWKWANIEGNLIRISVKRSNVNVGLKMAWRRHGANTFLESMVTETYKENEQIWKAIRFEFVSITLNSMLSGEMAWHRHGANTFLESMVTGTYNKNEQIWKAVWSEFVSITLMSMLDGKMAWCRHGANTFLESMVTETYNAEFVCMDGYSVYWLRNVKIWGWIVKYI